MCKIDCSPKDCISLDKEQRPRVTELHRWKDDDEKWWFCFSGYSIGPFKGLRELNEHVRQNYEEVGIGECPYRM